MILRSLWFFAPTTASAKVWYWRAATGEYEFYDGPGFHPRSGDQFQIVTRDVIAEWRRQQEAVAGKKKAEQEQREKEARERLEQETQQARQAAERERQAKEAAAEASRQQQQSANECDRLAANPT